jgi:hypothetical protein
VTLNHRTGGLASRWAHGPGPLPLLVAVTVAFGVGAAQLEPFTRPTDAAIALATLAVFACAVAAGWLRRGPVGEPLRPHGPAWTRGLVVWLVIIGTIGLFQLAQFQSNPRHTYPTLSSLASIAFAHWPVRAAAIAAWVALGLYIIGPRR